MPCINAHWFPKLPKWFPMWSDLSEAPQGGMPYNKTISVPMVPRNATGKWLNHQSVRLVFSFIFSGVLVRWGLPWCAMVWNAIAHLALRTGHLPGQRCYKGAVSAASFPSVKALPEGSAARAWPPQRIWLKGANSYFCSAIRIGPWSYTFL